ncbi:hypothetical protein BJY00DRAFT_282255, partial [Aspergillus carlsbadensis]
MQFNGPCVAALCIVSPSYAASCRAARFVACLLPRILWPSARQQLRLHRLRPHSLHYCRQLLLPLPPHPGPLLLPHSRRPVHLDPHRHLHPAARPSHPDPLHPPHPPDQHLPSASPSPLYPSYPPL